MLSPSNKIVAHVGTPIHRVKKMLSLEKTRKWYKIFRFSNGIAQRVLTQMGYNPFKGYEFVNTVFSGFRSVNAVTDVFCFL